MSIKPQTEFSSFEALDIRLGEVVKVEPSLAKKPTYRFTVDFGGEIGTKVTVAAYTHIEAEKLLGLKVLGLVNVGSRKMGPEKSEFLFLGVPDKDGNAHPITVLDPSQTPLGGGVY